MKDLGARGAKQSALDAYGFISTDSFFVLFLFSPFLSRRATHGRGTKACGTAAEVCR